MIRSSACQPWQPDLPGHAGDRGDLLSYTTPWDTILRSRVRRNRNRGRRADLEWSKCRGKAAGNETDRVTGGSGRTRGAENEQQNAGSSGDDLTKAYIQWIGRMVGHRMNEGKWIEIGPFEWTKVLAKWDAYILTSMFHHIGGSKPLFWIKCDGRSSGSIARCLPASFELLNLSLKKVGFLSGSSARITPCTSMKRRLSAMSP